MRSGRRRERAESRPSAEPNSACRWMRSSLARRCGRSLRTSGERPVRSPRHARIHRAKRQRSAGRLRRLELVPSGRGTDSGVDARLARDAGVARLLVPDERLRGRVASDMNRDTRRCYARSCGVAARRWRNRPRSGTRAPGPDPALGRLARRSSDARGAAAISNRPAGSSCTPANASRDPAPRRSSCSSATPRASRTRSRVRALQRHCGRAEVGLPAD